MPYRRERVVLQMRTKLHDSERNVARPAGHLPQRRPDRGFTRIPRPAAVLPDITRATPLVPQLPRISGPLHRAPAGPAAGVPPGPVPSDRGTHPPPPGRDDASSAGQGRTPHPQDGRGYSRARHEVLQHPHRAPPEGAGLQQQPVPRLTGNASRPRPAGGAPALDGWHAVGRPADRPDLYRRWPAVIERVAAIRVVPCGGAPASGSLAWHG